MNILNYNEAIEALYPFLEEYLQSKGIDTSGHFSCLSPDHADTDPSCSIAPSGKAFHCFGCLPGSQLVRTENGLMPIAELQIGDKVWTHNGTLQTVINVIKRNNKLAMMRFRVGRIIDSDLVFTANHTMQVVRNVHTLPYFYKDSKRGLRIDNDYKQNRNYKTSLHIEEVWANDVYEGDYFVFPVSTQVKSASTWTLDTRNLIKEYTHGPKNERITSITFDADMYWLCGIYAAEGNTYRGGINFSLNSKEIHYAERIQQIIEKKFNKLVTIHKIAKKPNSLQVTCSSTDLEHVFKYLFGTGASKKSFTCARNLLADNKINRKAFYQGLVDGDGNNKTGLLRLTSKKLISLAQHILISLQQPFSYKTEPAYIDKNGIYHQESYSLYKMQRECNDCFYEEIDGQPYCLLRVKDIKTEDPISTVWDITVENTHSFLCEHYAVHNCGISGGIFNAAHYLEGLPMVGQEFIQHNLIPLAERYKIQIESVPLSEDQLYELDTYRIYRAAGDLISGAQNCKAFDSAITERKWSENICKEFGIGCVADYKVFREELKKLGFSASFIDDVDLGRKEIFGSDRLIFPIRDHRGRPVGFASRNLSYTEDRQNGAKYVNQRSTGSKCNIYKKGSRLFGLDRVLARKTKKSDPIYIFEGYGDVVTAVDAGLTNCVAIGGTALTAEQVFLLKDQGFYNLILCLDGDTAGQDNTARLLDTTLSGHKDLKVSLVIIPQQQDPDEFIREHGIAKFKELKKWSAFEWRLSRFDHEAEPEDICKSMIPLIMNEASYIVQEKMCHILSKETGVTLKTIQSELDRLENKKDHERARDKREIIDRMVHSLSRDPDAAEQLIQEAENKLFDLAKKYDNNAFSSEKCLAALLAKKNYEESLDGNFSGFKLGNDLHNLEMALAGNWKKDIWMCLGGKPNAGKTSFLSKLLFEISRQEENDAIVLYHTIDDTFEQVLPKFVAIAEGSKLMTLNQVMDPNYHAPRSSMTDITDRREVGYSLVRDLMQQERLIIKDANDGLSLAFADNMIKYWRTKYPERNIIYVLDNFHKLSDFSGKDERVRFKHLSTAMKNLACKYHICVVTTVEYRKIDKGKHAQNEDIAESGQIEYDANVIMHLHNEVHEKQDAATHRHTHNFCDGTGEKICPRIEIGITKNKITAFKNKLWFDFYPDCSDFVYVPDSKVHADAQAAKQENENGQSGMKEKYLEFREEVESKGQKPGRAFFMFRDHFDLTDEEAGKYVAQWK